MIAEQDAQRLQAYADGIREGARLAWDAIEAGTPRALHEEAIEFTTRMLTTPAEERTRDERDILAIAAERAIEILREMHNVETWAQQAIRDYQAGGGADPA